MVRQFPWVLSFLPQLAAYLTGCDPAPIPVAHPKAANRVTPTSASAGALVEAGAPSSIADCTLAIRRSKPLTKSNWGSVTPDVFLTPAGKHGLRVWFPTPDAGQLRTATLKRNGRLNASVKTSPFAHLGEGGLPQIASKGHTTVAVGTVYVSARNVEVFASFFANGRWSKPVRLDVGPEFNTDSTVAIGPKNTAVAWGYGLYPTAPDLAFGILEGGRVTHTAIVARNVDPEGIALIAVPSGWVLIYGIGSAARKGGIFALHLGNAGKVRQKTQIAASGIWPVAAVNDAGEIGVAFRSDLNRKGGVNFVRLDQTGKLRSPQMVVADRHDDPLAGEPGDNLDRGLVLKGSDAANESRQVDLGQARSRQTSERGI